MIQKLVDERKLQGKNPAYMANLLGLKTPGAYYKKENGSIRFSLEEGLIVAKDLNKTVEYLFGDYFLSK